MSKYIVRIIIGFSVLLAAIGLVGTMEIDRLWFAGLGYPQLWWTNYILPWGFGLWGGGMAALWGFLHLRYVAAAADATAMTLLPLRGKDLQLLGKVSLPARLVTPEIEWRWLLCLHGGIGLGLAWLAIVFSRDVLPQFFPDRDLGLTGSKAVGYTIVLAIIIVVFSIAKGEVFRRVAVWAIAVSVGMTIGMNWQRLLLAIGGNGFGLKDPVFLKDIGFYVFYMPILELADKLAIGLFGGTFLVVLSGYLQRDGSWQRGRLDGLTVERIRHLFFLLGSMGVSLAGYLWLARYELLFSPRGVTYGASYTDLSAQLPFLTVASWVLFGFFFFLSILLFCQQLIRGFVEERSDYDSIESPWQWENNRSKPLSRWKSIDLSVDLTIVDRFSIWLARKLKRLATIGLGLWLLGNYLIPAIVQIAIVQPNEIEREAKYIERSIEYTRRGFGLESIEVKPFDSSGNLTAADIAANRTTIDNIRLWDDRPLLDSNRQLQQIRPYYRFASADLDRYTIANKPRQTIVSPREIDITALPTKAKTWVNQHLVYTHGYGFTVSPVNTVEPGGLPSYFVKDIGTPEKPGALQTSNAEVRAAIPVNSPRIYYGELTDNYIFAPSREKELDYPQETNNNYSRYHAGGGIPIGRNWWRKLIAAIYLKDPQILLTDRFDATTQLLMRRDIVQRARTLVPWLQYDSDPYLVSVDIGRENHLYWLLDAYTTSDRYPYADPGSGKENYIRDAVKVTIDAYNGQVNYYINDAKDPILQAWSRLFPGVFQSTDRLPNALRQHRRYPKDLFARQADRLRDYHAIDPRTFYNREDRWQIPQEIYRGKPQKVEPYYAVTKLPTSDSAEFLLILPFTPDRRTNAIAWLAARSDGAQYGKLLLYLFGKQQLVYGPEQVEALANQDPSISQQISLWNRQGSRALQGNLLIVPIERSLLYVEPLYLEAEQNSLPTLARTIVTYRQRIAMAESLDLALEKLFGKPPTPKPSAPPS